MLKLISRLSVLRTVVIIVMSAVVSCIVSWAIAMTSTDWKPKTTFMGYDRERQAVLRVKTLEVLGGKAVEINRFFWRDQPNSMRLASDAPPPPLWCKHRYERFLKESDHGITEEHSVLRTIVGFGWPFPCLTYETSRIKVYRIPAPHLVNQPVESAIAIPSVVTADSTVYRALPYGAVPLGLLGNSVFYAACVIFVLALIRIVRSTIRCYSGRCRQCGYSLMRNESLVCPECGTPTAGGRK